MRKRIRSTPALASALLLAVVCLAAAGGGAETAARSAPVALIATTVDQVLVILNDPKLDKAGRLSRLEDLAYQRFDFSTMSRLVVAQYWKRFSPEQQEELVTEFTAFLARTYGDRIDRYTSEDVEVTGERPEPRGDVTVMTRIVGGDYGGAEVDYRLREGDGKWRVIDVKVEGISLVLNYRDQFKAVLSRGGPSGLLEALRKKNAEGAAA